jgi:hypothetical protein
LTLLLGIGINRFLENINNRKKINRNGEIWIAELAALELPILRQISHIEKYLYRRDIFGSEKEPFLIESELSCEAFNVLNKSDLLQYLQKSLHKSFKESVFMSGRISVILTTLKTNYQELYGTLNTYTKEAIAAPDKIFDLLKMIILELDAVKSKAAAFNKENDIILSKVSQIEDIINEHVSLDKSYENFDIFSLENKLYWPILNVLKTVINAEGVSKTMSIIYESLRILSNVQTEYERLRKMIIYCKEDYEEDLRNIQIVLQSINPK